MTLDSVIFKICPEEKTVSVQPRKGKVQQLSKWSCGQRQKDTFKVVIRESLIFECKMNRYRFTAFHSLSHIIYRNRFKQSPALKISQSLAVFSLVKAQLKSSSAKQCLHVICLRHIGMWDSPCHTLFQSNSEFSVRLGCLSFVSLCVYRWLVT